MKIVIQNQSDRPIYAQIEEQIKEQILSGLLPEGTLLPSIRKLARETGVSVITTSRAYSELESGGFIASVQGKGSIVLPQSDGMLKEQYLRRIEEALTEAIRSARTAGLTQEELHDMLRLMWKEEE